MYPREYSENIQDRPCKKQGCLRASGLEPIRFSEATAPSILRQKSLQYLHIATHFFLVYPKHLFTENCAHPSPKEFLKDFGDARRRKVRTFQDEPRRKTQKWIAEGLVGSNPVRLAESFPKQMFALGKNPFANFPFRQMNAGSTMLALPARVRK